MKKILISITIIGIVAAIGIGATVAYFNDTETSTGNIFVAGSIDLKVDHVLQTYNDVYCKTCSVEIKSDTSNQVVWTDVGVDPVAMPHNAVEVSNPHPAWTVTGDIPGATWIWATDPTLQDDTTQDVYYTFEKTFEWWGPVDGITLSLGVGTDNGYRVELNGNLVGEDMGELNYKSPADTYSGFGSYLEQGQNTLEITVKNKGMAGGTPAANPAGLLYSLVIDGDCNNDYFKNNCTLFGIRDLGENDHFWRFDDVKPGDHGTNVISLHVDNNDAYVCLINDDIDDQENVLTETEAYAGDDSDIEGELSDYLELFIWNDVNGDGQYNPSNEEDLYEGGFITTEMIQLSLSATSSDYLGIAWCLGDQMVNHNTGEISCSGSGNQDQAQTDKLIASLVLYAEQQRNNSAFDCSEVTLP